LEPELQKNFLVLKIKQLFHEQIFFNLNLFTSI